MKQLLGVLPHERRGIFRYLAYFLDLPRWCVKNDNELKKCEDLTKKNLTVTCVKFDNCLDAVIKGEADLVEAVPDDIVKNGKFCLLMIMVLFSFGADHLDEFQLVLLG